VEERLVVRLARRNARAVRLVRMPGTFVQAEGSQHSAPSKPTNNNVFASNFLTFALS
jgi:hypothetical protein